MKTTKLIPTVLFATLFLLFTGFSSYAIKPAIAPAEKIHQVIKENLKYPAQAVKTGATGSVDVTFVINDDGQIVIKKMSCDCPEIADNVKEQLANICCKGIKTPYNQYYKVTISFKLV
jgi:hypothetical protein